MRIYFHLVCFSDPGRGVPYDFTGTSCGIADGTYYASYSESTTAVDVCEGDPSSTITVSGNTLTVNMCTDANTSS